MKPKAYIVNMSTGKPIRIDPDELVSVLTAIKAGSPVRVRQGILNTAHLVAIREDEDRVERWLEAHSNQLDSTTHEMVRRGPEWRELPDIFQDVLPAPAKAPGGELPF